MSSATESDFSCKKFMAPQPQFWVEIMNQINLTTLCKMRSRRCFTIHTAIFSSCQKKHAERLAALGMQISDKDTREQTAAAAGKEFQRFVEHTLFLCHTFRLKHFDHMCPK